MYRLNKVEAGSHNIMLPLLDIDKMIGILYG